MVRGDESSRFVVVPLQLRLFYLARARFNYHMLEHFHNVC